MEASSPPSSTAYNNKVHTVDKPPEEAWSPEPQKQPDDKAETANGTAFEKDWQSTVKKPTDLSVVTFMVTVLFNHVFGIFAYHFTVSAKHNWNLKNYTKAKQHARYGTILIVLGVILGLATYTIALSSYFTLKRDTSCSVAPSSANSSNTPNITDSTTSSTAEDSKAAVSTTSGITELPLTSPQTDEPANSNCCRVCKTGTRCKTYCTSTSAQPIFPDINQKYEECCLVVINC